MVAVDFLGKRFPIRRAVLDMRGHITEVENKIIFYMYQFLGYSYKSFCCCCCLTLSWDTIQLF